MRASAVVLVLCLYFACRPDPPPTAGLAAPWGEMALPIGEGVVEASGSDELHVRYEGKPAAEALSKWHESLVEAGWAAGDPVHVTGITLVTFTQDGESLDLTVASKGPRTDVVVHR